MDANSIINFWFEELTPKDWWKKSDEFDHDIKSRFKSVHRAAVAGELYAWRETPHGRLAEIIVIDQFSRNMFRDRAESFAYDGIALVLSQVAIAAKADAKLGPSEKAFLYMPLMHSESLAVHQLALQVFDQPGLENNLEFEKKHRAIIEQFGRYPHRNAILDRASTPAEQKFLKQPGSSF